jgi:carboxylesterase type B
MTCINLTRTLIAVALSLFPTNVAAEQVPLGINARPPPGAPIVTLANGTYYGQYSAEFEQDHFLGIPFAKPPVGDLRFAPPQPLDTAFADPQGATVYGPECIGYGYDQWILGNHVSEDCLTINIVRPSGAAGGDDLPVAVWIHGGVIHHLRYYFGKS